MKTKPLFITILTIFFLTFITANANAHYLGYTINALYGTTPNIDGTISPPEWSDATTFTFNYTTGYTKHDGESLYFAFSMPDTTPDPQNEGIMLYIDTAHDGGTSPQPDDIAFALLRNGTALEMISPFPPYPPDGNWTAAIQEIMGGYTVEFNITYKKIGLTAGVTQTLGLLIYDFDTGPPPQYYLWPPIGFSPSAWGDLTSIDDWIPEFQPLIAITTLITAALITTIIRKKQISINP